ncbi:hypothetical protein [Streptomyces hesseae]|uniref:DUF2637 domain-containing protein n=1 Tax=Streptomyces hesseae TaxID=3075519 RepID=A0ABU2SM49_9ACTN|nr:hypothetical protein [Streptomyces sp. DSM 40473]MDT0449965.1 hypothetical protein [Streptomyces sp. DSM 40473]
MSVTTPVSEGLPLSQSEYEDTQKALAQLQHVGTLVTTALLALGSGGLAFTCVNVTVFASRHEVPSFIAWMLDPLGSLALLVVLYVDGVLTPQGYRPKGWPFLLRWFAGFSIWLMNCWQSLYPDGVFSWWPTAPDHAGLLLHSFVPFLVIFLAEAGAGYRKYLAERTAELKTVIHGYEERQRHDQRQREQEALAERRRAEERAQQDTEREAREAAEAARIVAQREADRQAREVEIKAEREAREHDARMVREASEARIREAREEERLRREREEIEARRRREEEEREAWRERERAENEAAIIRARGEAEQARILAEAQVRSAEGEAREKRDQQENEAAAKAARAREQTSRRDGESSKTARRRTSGNERRQASRSGGAASQGEERIPRDVRAAQREEGIREAARAVIADRKITAKALGDQFGRAETWGGDCIREARKRLAENADFRAEIEEAELETMFQVEAAREHAR